MCVAYKVRYDQYHFDAISIGPASELSADHENVQMSGCPQPLCTVTNHCSRSTKDVLLVP